ncbi:MAG TPA: twin-arginine translocation signal domain-containing protein, partial [Thiothrix sp.]|nr:twin-arginine translocation signal domain-containing protein [Thiothrix sp.]
MARAMLGQHESNLFKRRVMTTSKHCKKQGTFMLIKHTSRAILQDNDVTDYAIYQDRRRFLKTSLATGLLGTGLFSGQSQALSLPNGTGDEKKTPYEDITTYNNYYEFGTRKSDPAK